jgi:hypothetical protein
MKFADVSVNRGHSPGSSQEICDQAHDYDNQESEGTTHI